MNARGQGAHRALAQATLSLVIVAVATCWLGVGIAAASSGTRIAPSAARHARRFWTPARMKRAKPVEVHPVRRGGAASFPFARTDRPALHRVPSLAPRVASSGSSRFEQVPDQLPAFARVRAAFFADSRRFSALLARVRAAFLAAAFRFCGPWLIRSCISATAPVRSAIAFLAAFGAGRLLLRIDSETFRAVPLRTPSERKRSNRSSSLFWLAILPSWTGPAWSQLYCPPFSGANVDAHLRYPASPSSTNTPGWSAKCGGSSPEPSQLAPATACWSSFLLIFERPSMRSFLASL
jgi:hypothetical protein